MIEIRDVPDPVPAGNEVLVRVCSSALNRADILQREGRYPAPFGAPADIPGLEIAGEVVALGAAARRWRVGASVFGIVGGGGHAQLVTAHEDALCEVPSSLRLEDAGAVPEAFITAHDALVTQAGLVSGETLLVHAVASGVGLAAVQLARVIGAISFGTSRSPGKLDAAREHGMMHGISLPDGPDQLPQKVRGLTAGRGVIEVTAVFAREVVPLLAGGDVCAVIDSRFPLHRIGDAHRRLQGNETLGKVVIDMES